VPDYPHVLVATLGGQPQIVTFTLDLLLEKGYPINEVFVLHPRATSQSRLQHALACLNAEFTDKPYHAMQHPIHFHSRVLELNRKPIDDIVDDIHADGTLNTIHRLISNLKRQRYHIHLSVTGGRRLMSLLAISVASLNFDRHDHIWHLYTPQAVQEQANGGKVMHISSDAGIKLIHGPFIALGAYIYNPEYSFQTAQAEQRKGIDDQEHARCRQVVVRLTPRELEVLRAFANGLSNQEVGKELGLAIKTVAHYKTRLLDLCREVWYLDPKARLGYHFLYKTFAPYFDTAEYTSTS
jgi:CRISPR-associated protein Csx14